MPRLYQPPCRGRAERDALVLQWLGLSKCVVRKMASHPVVRDLGEEDAVQTGYLGLIRAAELWDETCGVQFQTYAYRAIWSQILAAAQQGRLVHVCPAHLRYRHTFRAARAGSRCVQMGDLLQYRQQPAARPNTVLAGDVADALARLDPRQQQVIKALFFDGLSGAELGRRLGMSKQLVRHHRNRGLERLREHLGGYGPQARAA